MGDHHQRARSPMPALHDRLDRDAVLAEDLRHHREHAGPVGDLHVQVEGALDVFDERQRAAAERAAARAGASR